MPEPMEAILAPSPTLPEAAAEHVLPPLAAMAGLEDMSAEEARIHRQLAVAAFSSSATA